MVNFVWTDHLTPLILGAIEITIIVPFLVHSFYRLRKHINDIYFCRRNKLITITWFTSLAIYNILFLIILTPYLIYSQNLSSLVFSTNISSTIRHVVSSSFIWLNLPRCWQLYYNKKYYDGLQNNKWRSKINQNDVDFYVKYRSSIGNYKTIYCIATIIWIMDSCIFFTMISLFICQHCVILAEFPSYFSFYAFAGMMLCSSHVDDTFFIRKELMYILSLQAIGSVLSFIINVSVGHYLWHDDNVIMFKIILPTFIGCITSAFIIYFGVHWVIKKNIMQYEEQILYKTMRRNHNKTYSISLKEILTDEQALDLFMQHLIREYNFENVLFLIETVNFKRLMIKLGYIHQDMVPSLFLESVHSHAQFRSESFSAVGITDTSDGQRIISHTRDDSMLSLHESIKLVQNMECPDMDTSLTTSSSFLRNVSKTQNKEPQRRQSEIEMNKIIDSTDVISTVSMDNSNYTPSAKDSPICTPEPSSVSVLSSVSVSDKITNDSSDIFKKKLNMVTLESIADSPAHHGAVLHTSNSEDIENDNAGTDSQCKTDIITNSTSNVMTSFGINSKASYSSKRSTKQTQRQIDSSWINFPNNVPISPFLYQQKDGKHLNPWIVACQMVEKYIQNSSMLCINISWSVRQDILQFMAKHEHIYEVHYRGKTRKSSISISFSSLSFKRKHKNLKKADGKYHRLCDKKEDKYCKNKIVIDEDDVLRELSGLFDNACVEIYGLLGDSYSRFVTTEQYQLLLKKKKK